MSTRDRHNPWFRTPGERWERALAAHALMERIDRAARDYSYWRSIYCEASGAWVDVTEPSDEARVTTTMPVHAVKLTDIDYNPAAEGLYEGDLL